MKFYFLIMLMLAIVPVKGQQETDIVNYLKQIESGDKESVLKVLPELKSSHKNDPSVLFLEALLTEDGTKAVSMFESLTEKYPQSKYADASLYRISSYYYSADDHVMAKKYFEKLKSGYPSSPYIKLAYRKFETKKEDIKAPVVSKKNNIIYKYTIQAGAFSSKGNAESLKRELESSGLSAEIKEKNVAGSIFQVVYVGKFAGEDEAHDQLEILNKKFKLNGRVTETGNGK